MFVLQLTLTVNQFMTDLTQASRCSFWWGYPLIPFTGKTYPIEFHVFFSCSFAEHEVSTFVVVHTAKALARLAGNSMAMRSIMVAICIGLRALNPALAQEYLKRWSINVRWGKCCKYCCLQFKEIKCHLVLQTQNILCRMCEVCPSGKVKTQI